MLNQSKRFLNTKNIHTHTNTYIYKKQIHTQMQFNKVSKEQLLIIRCEKQGTLLTIAIIKGKVAFQQHSTTKSMSHMILTMKALRKTDRSTPVEL